MTLLFLTLALGLAQEVDFAREVRPILAEHCFTCHGPDAAAREADLRLDGVQGLFGDRGGYFVVDRAHPKESELLRRLRSSDSSERMPPAGEEGLTEEEIARIVGWIEGGAEWEPHWAFVAPERPATPALDGAGSAWVRNPVDAFVLARLREEGLGPSPEADRRTLIRRLSLDLIGLPPAPEEVEAFVGDTRPDAYGRLVERLFASPHHGERLALAWLDLARYADTNGYSIDGGRHMWAWRDQVIEAFNANQPFDQFTSEQLAGDLLDEATPRQRVASGFNRNHMNTHEGGTIEEEYLVSYAVDRVRTTAQTWMGLTLQCAQCHDHKYDPLSQREYYRFFAFFDSITERGLDGNGGVNSVPFLKLLSEEQQARLAELRAEEARLESQWLAPSEELAAAQRAWEREERARLAAWVEPSLGDWQVAGPLLAPSGDEAWSRPWLAEAGQEGGEPIEWRAAPEYADGEVHTLPGNDAATYLRRTVTVADPTKITLSLGSDDSIRFWVNAELVLENNAQRGAAPGQERLTVDLPGGASELRLEIVNYGGPGGFYFELVRPAPPGEVLAALERTPEQRDAEQERRLMRYFRSQAPELEPGRRAIAELAARIAEIESAPLTTTMVMEERSMRRETFILERGQYDRPLEPVARGTPACLPPFPSDAPADRLGLSRWLVDPSHPLTARVAVNSWWQLLFGRGLVETPEDFGTRGAAPSHPELLDWLAVELVESGWDVRAILRTIVTSATYRQDSQTSPALLARDPHNELLARGARFRLQAELVRDLALAASGLLVPEIGGPSVRPYQPDGLWREVSHLGSTPATEQEYVQDHGEGLWRRSLYTIWKRTVPPPTMVVFDAPNREMCVSRRGSTQTPLQALALLNETGFVEAARALAQRMLEEEAGDEGRIDCGFRCVLARPPSAEEAEVLLEALRRERAAFAAEPDAAAALLAVGEAPRNPAFEAPEHAAWTILASTLLNLEEATTRN